MRAFSLRVGEIISLPEQELSIEVLDVQEDHVRLGVTQADRFVLIGDEATSEVDQALEAAAIATGAACLRIRLDR